MAGLIKPYVAEELVSRLKETCSIPIALHSHATTGMSTTSLIKAVEAGIDMVDTSISSMSMTYGHSATESVVAILEDTPRNTGLDLKLLEEIAADFRAVRKKYAKFEGALRGVDSRILVAQVPGGMLTNMESQLRQQGAADRLDEVLEEIPRVREDLGHIALVTPTSQIVGTQAVLNVLMGERYKTITAETAGVLKGTYGATAAPVNKELQQRVLGDGEEPVTCRPADNLSPEMEHLTVELEGIAQERGIELADETADDVLIYALFPQVGLKFLENRDNPDAFEPPPWLEAPSKPSTPDAPVSAAAPVSLSAPESYQVEVNGKSYSVKVAPGGAVETIVPAPDASPPIAAGVPSPGGAEPVPAPLAGSIVKVKVAGGERIEKSQVIMILEAMKMETEVRSPRAGQVVDILVKEGGTVQVGDTLLTLS